MRGQVFFAKLSSFANCAKRIAGKRRSTAAAPGGVSGNDVRDLMVAAVEHRVGMVTRLPVTIEWLSDNGSCYIAGNTAASLATSVSNRGRPPRKSAKQRNG